jgi:hypothetical protein
MDKNQFYVHTNLDEYSYFLKSLQGAESLLGAPVKETAVIVNAVG